MRGNKQIKKKNTQISYKRTNPPEICEFGIKASASSTSSSANLLYRSFDL